MAHIHEQWSHHNNLKHKIKPRLTYQQTDIQCNGARIESQYISVFHQRLTGSTEFIAQFLRNIITILCLYQRIELLEIGSHSLLLTSIVSIKIKEYFPPEVSLPRQTVKYFTLLPEVVQLTSALSFQEIKMNIAVIIRQRTLLTVTNRTRKHSQNPDKHSPMHSVTDIERHRLIHQPKTDSHINSKKPNITCKPVQHTSPLGFLSCEASQLPVSAIIMIRPHQQ